MFYELCELGGLSRIYAYIYIYFYLQTLPKDFAGFEVTPGGEHHKKRLRITGKGSWQIRCFYFQGFSQISEGWDKFAIDMNLHENELVCFEASGAYPDTWFVTISDVSNA